MIGIVEVMVAVLLPAQALMCGGSTGPGWPLRCGHGQKQGRAWAFWFQEHKLEVRPGSGLVLSGGRDSPGEGGGLGSGW